MITFNVGPSRITNEVKDDIKKAVDENILEISHRSDEFTEISKTAVLRMKEFLDIPEEYGVIFTSSATESMQLVVQNCCRKKAFHFTCGNFSKLFSEISKANNKEIFLDEVENGELNDFKNVEVGSDIDFITITHNETSTGVMCSKKDIACVRKGNPAAILAVDVTSSVGVSEFDFSNADIWLFSVQKCLGLPSGLGVLVLSPRAMEKSKELGLIGENEAGIFTLDRLSARMVEKYQTLSTPNILGIYLLAKVCTRNLKNGGLMEISNQSTRKIKAMERFISASKELSFFVKDIENRSETVFCLKAKKETIEMLHIECRKRGYLLGKGYGNLKHETIRISNFPAISVDKLDDLLGCIGNVLDQKC